MQIKICSRNLLPRLLGVNAITLYPFILVAEENPSLTLLTHEMIHVQQIRKEGVLLFYIRYLYYYIVNLLSGMGHRQAYLRIPYEIEAYRDETRLLTSAEMREIYGDQETEDKKKDFKV